MENILQIDLTSDSVRTYEYENDVCQMLERIVKPGWNCADVGAYVGFITVLLAELVGRDGQVFSFEAFPDHVKTLKKNIATQGLSSRVKAENLIISDGSQKKVCLYSGLKAGEWNIVGHDIEGNPTEPEILNVPATSLDKYFPPESRLNLIKIDIEGAAGLAFSGMKRILKKSRPVLVIEFHDKEEWESRDILYEAGYDIYDIHGAKLNPMEDTHRHYHCLAIPEEIHVITKTNSAPSL